MRRHIYSLIIVAIAITFVSPAFSQERSLASISKLGKISSDNENEGSEKDPVFKSPPKEKPKYIVKQTTGTLSRLKDLPNAQQIINDIAEGLTKREINISILSQHKYMISSCLGIKASVGEFRVRLGMPVAKLEAGGIFLQFTIEKIAINGITIRMRPCQKDLQCHFGERFTIGGAASNVRLEIRMNPMVDLQNCQTLSAVTPHFKWRIGGLNLKPLQNNLDEMAKNLIEDAMTVASEMIMPGRLVEATTNAIFNTNTCIGMPAENNGNNEGEVEAQVSDLEDRIRILEEKVQALENNSQRDGLSKSSNASESTANKPNESRTVENEKWEISPSGLKGATGMISSDFPEGVQWSYYALTTENKGLISVNNTKTLTLTPGNYNIIFSHVPVLSVPIQKGMKTRLKAGVLHIVNAMGFGLYDENKATNYVSLTGPLKLGLPAGTYYISVSGTMEKVEIKDGEVTEF